MPLFRYEAIDTKQKKIKGAIDAETLSDAKEKLLKQSIFLTNITPLSINSSFRWLKKKEILQFTKELARLLKAGLPLYESLCAIEEKYRGHKGHPLFLDLAEQVRSGVSFSESLSRHNKAFDLLFTGIVANAEKTGNLAEALEHLSLLLSKQSFMRKQLISTFLYPSFLFAFCLAVLSSLLFFVIPSLQELFEGRQLHPFTQLVFATSEMVRKSQVFFGFLFLFAGFGAVLSFSSSYRSRLLAKFLQAPLIKHFFAKVALIRFARASSTLLEGGVPLVEAFSQARRIMRHPLLEAVVKQAEVMIGQGEAIHVPFQGHLLIPPLVPRLLAIAQQGGNLPLMFKQIAEIYEEDLEQHLTYFSSIAQPLLLLFLGGIIGFVLLSVLIPLTDVSSFAAN